MNYEYCVRSYAMYIIIIINSKNNNDDEEELKSISVIGN